MMGVMEQEQDLQAWGIVNALDTFCQGIREYIWLLFNSGLSFCFLSIMRILFWREVQVVLFPLSLSLVFLIFQGGDEAKGAEARAKCLRIAQEVPGSPEEYVRFQTVQEGCPRCQSHVEFSRMMESTIVLCRRVQGYVKSYKFLRVVYNVLE